MSDGSVRAIVSVEDIQPGYVIRSYEPDGSLTPFSDTVILSHWRPELGEDQRIKLARPYLYATLWETCCESSLMGEETFTATYKNLVDLYKLVLKANGKPYCNRTSF